MSFQLQWHRVTPREGGLKKLTGPYKKLLHFPGEYINIGIKPGRQLPPKRD